MVENKVNTSYTGHSKTKVDSILRRSIDAPTDPEGKDVDELIIAANVMRQSGYQNDPLAATMKTRSMGLSKINPTKE